MLPQRPGHFCMSALLAAGGWGCTRLIVLGLHPRHIRTAIDFATTHRQEIEAQVADNDAAAEQARQNR